MASKTVEESRTVISQFTLPSQTNPLGSIHGGETMKMMDNAAAVCAMRHCNSPVVTLAVDDISFYVPIYVGELVVCKAQITYVGRSSMEVEVEVIAENVLGKTSRKALTAYFTMVGLDEKFKPIEVPRLEITNEAEKERFEMGRQRAERRKRSAGR